MNTAELSVVTPLVTKLDQNAVWPHNQGSHFLTPQPQGNHDNTTLDTL